MMCFVGKTLINDFIKKNLIDLKKIWESGSCEFFSKHGWLCELKKNSCRLRQFDEKKVAFDLEY